MKLFEYAIIYSPNKTNSKTSEKAKLVAFDKILANDKDEAQILVARQIPEQYLGKLSEVTLAVRPF